MFFGASFQPLPSCPSLAQIGSFRREITGLTLSTTSFFPVYETEQGEHAHPSPEIALLYDRRARIGGPTHEPVPITAG